MRLRMTALYTLMVVVIMLSAANEPVMLKVVTLSAVMLNVIMLSVVALLIRHTISVRS
jgi:hypothetical protein